MSNDVEKLIDNARALSDDDLRRLRTALLERDVTATFGQSKVPSQTAVPDYQQRLIEAGLLKTIKIRDHNQKLFEGFKPFPISGKPLSESILEERR
jgi:hypothetical protein